MKLLVATGNAGKLREIGALLAPHGIQTLGLSSLPHAVEIVEDGETFAENARKKALALHRATGLAVLADDSGLAVTALGGRPGVHSARYAGPGAADADNNAKLLQELAGVPDEARAAAFLCAMILIAPDGTQHTAEGRLEGRMLREPRGAEGFGYDPIFQPEGEARTLAEIPLAEKNTMSHRFRALRAILPEILSLAEAESK
jgi:XTP/dITP diphosphohydrolase